MAEPKTDTCAQTGTLTYQARAARVLDAADPSEKCAEAAAALSALQRGEMEFDGAARLSPPDRPARPERPPLLPPKDVPRRRLGSPEGRFALLHAIAHIELNAIDLAFDMVTRFAAEIAENGLDASAFIADWVSVGADEARHFSMLDAALGELGGSYGDLPAHDGLWQAAIDTADSVLARLAIAPMVLEARGLDVTPGMIERLIAAGDVANAERLKIIYTEEVGHVETGSRWFHLVCAAKKLPPETTFRDLVKTRFAGQLKPPFNGEARARADMPPSFYEAL